MAVFRFKNNKVEAFAWTGMLIQPGEYYLAESEEISRWQNDPVVLQDIVNGSLILNNGVADLTSITSAINYLKQTDTSPKDSDGSPLVRQKMTRSGWHFEPRSIDFITSVAGSLYNRRHNGNGIDDGTDYGDAVLKFFNAAGQELTSNYETCVRTQLDWQPQYDMDIIGATVSAMNAPTGSDRAYAWVVVAPDIPENMGGSVPFMAGGWNLRFFKDAPTTFLDGRGVKAFAYDPVYNSNKFRVIIKHTAGAQIELQFVAEHFRA